MFIMEPRKMESQREVDMIFKPGLLRILTLIFLDQGLVAFSHTTIRILLDLSKTLLTSVLRKSHWVTHLMERL